VYVKNHEGLDTGKATGKGSLKRIKEYPVGRQHE